MSVGHTSGPWQSMHDFDLAGEFSIVGNVDGEIIDGHTHHSYTLVAEVYDNDNLAEDRANARLIAAAPDLLTALKEQVAECFCDTCEMCARHEAIIAKAEGRS